jgi:hypothetical protein
MEATSNFYLYVIYSYIAHDTLESRLLDGSWLMCSIKAMSDGGRPESGGLLALTWLTSWRWPW